MVLVYHLVFVTNLLSAMPTNYNLKTSRAAGAVRLV
jgi:hypothetical protein